MEPLPKINVLKPFFVLILVGGGIWWLVTAMNTGNPMWFFPVQPSFSPSRLLVYHYGDLITLHPDDPQFGEVAAAVDSLLTAFNNQDLVDIGLGEGTLKSYHEQEFVLEVEYAEDIQFNLPVRMEHVNRILFPVDARHAGTNYIFIGNDTGWLAGALQVKSYEPLLETMRRLGYLEGAVGE